MCSFVEMSFLDAVDAVLLVPSDKWMDWECPGFPCAIVNYYETRDHTDIEQTCTPVAFLDPCDKLANGEKIAATKTERYNWTDHTTILGWHNSTKNHPRKGLDFACFQVNSNGQRSCLQGENAHCKSLCKDLSLLDLYTPDTG